MQCTVLQSILHLAELLSPTSNSLILSILSKFSCAFAGENFNADQVKEECEEAKMHFFFFKGEGD